MEALAKAEEILLETERALSAAIQRLKEVEEGIALLRKHLEEEEERKAELEKQKQLCEDRMGRAVRLIVGLAGEQIRWAQTVVEIRVSVKNAVGDILLASGIYRKIHLATSSLYVTSKGLFWLKKKIFRNFKKKN